MKVVYDLSKSIKLNYVSLFIGLCLSFFANAIFAETIKVLPNTVITDDITYKNVVLDLTNGSFILRNNATLTIQNSVIEGQLSKANPILFNVEMGKINLTNSRVNIKTLDLPAHPMTQSLEYVMQVALGKVELFDNTFAIDKSFTAGLLITSANLATNNIQIARNKFERFHGVLYLISSNSAVVQDNIFMKNTYGHIVVMGNSNKIIHNAIYYSGNNRLGNAIDVINSNDTLVSKNEIYTPTCHAIYLINSQNVTIDKNRIVGGITYAVNLMSYPEGLAKVDAYVQDLAKTNLTKPVLSNHINVTNNYMAQNRFGLAASDVESLDVENNIFIQRFQDNQARVFWTNNNILFSNVSDVTWLNNTYKEAYSQAVDGDDSLANRLVSFPQTGGVQF